MIIMMISTKATLLTATVTVIVVIIISVNAICKLEMSWDTVKITEISIIQMSKQLVVVVVAVVIAISQLCVIYVLSYFCQLCYSQ